MKRKLVSFDWAIKRILRSKANFAILEGFLSELLFDEIKIIEVLESESNKDDKMDKFNRLDIKVRNSKDELIIIEIQYSRELDYLQRILYATSKVITEHLKESEAYAKVSKVISVNILYFDFGDGDDYIYKGTTSFIGLHNKTRLKLNPKQQEMYKTNKVEKIYPEYYLIKVKNFNDIATDSLDEWIYFLKNEEIKDSFNAKGLKKAKEALDYLKMSDSERWQYEQHQTDLHHQASLYESSFVIGKIEGRKEGIERGRKEGIKKGIEKGIEKGIQQGIEKGFERGVEQERQKNHLKLITLVKKLAQQGFDTETIAELSAISSNEVKEILD